MSIFEFLQLNPGTFISIIFILGLLVGSFLNVVVYRLPLIMQRGWQRECAELLEASQEDSGEELTLSRPRSRCPHCGHTIRVIENIPVLSYLFLRGRCSACGERISVRYPVMELASGILCAIAAWHFGFEWQTAAALLFTWMLLAASAIDIDHQLLPDNLTLPFLWAGLFLALFGLFTDSQSAIIGAIAGYLSLWLVYHAFRLLTGKEGMGYGDFKLLGALGAWMGWQLLPLIILLSSVVGALVGVALIVFRGQNRDQPIPFGPYLAAAGWIALLWGDPLLQMYMSWAAPGG